MSDVESKSLRLTYCDACRRGPAAPALGLGQPGPGETQTWSGLSQVNIQYIMVASKASAAAPQPESLQQAFNCAAVPAV
jgi:hypothetical protein